MSKALTNDEVQYALDKFFTEPVVSNTQFFKMGAENTTGLIEGNFGSVVLRVWGERHSRMGARQSTDIEDELAFMHACRERQLPIPKTYNSLTGNPFETLPDGRTFSFMDYVEGSEPEHFTEPMIIELAEAVAQMDIVGETFTYPVPRSWQGTIIDLTHERIAAYRKLAIDDKVVDELIEKAERALAQTDFSELPYGPIHGDVMYQNIKYVGEHLSGIFDFDDCRESYLIEDITKVLFFSIEDPAHCVMGDNIANARLFVEAYEKVRPLTDAEKAALPALSMARFVYEILKFYLHGAKHPQAAEILEAKKAAYLKFKPLFEGTYTDYKTV